MMPLIFLLDQVAHMLFYTKTQYAKMLKSVEISAVGIPPFEEFYVKKKF